MVKSLNPKPLAATKNDNVENEQDTTKSQLIKEYVLAVEDNMAKKNINAGVTLKCIACKEYDPAAVVECKINGCPLWPFRCNALKLDKEPKEPNITVELELAVEGMDWEKMRQMEAALRNVKLYANDTRVCLTKAN